jgi:hypothetical protein
MLCVRQWHWPEDNLPLVTCEAVVICVANMRGNMCGNMCGNMLGQSQKLNGIDCRSHKRLPPGSRTQTLEI